MNNTAMVDSSCVSILVALASSRQRDTCVTDDASSNANMQETNRAMQAQGKPFKLQMRMQWTEGGAAGQVSFEVVLAPHTSSSNHPSLLLLYLSCLVSTRV